MKWVFNKNRPIYTQLIEHLQRGILTGEYPQDSTIPSVRLLALEAGVNPNTMQKALSALELQGLLFSKRTIGRFVTNNIQAIENLKEKLTIEQVDMYFNNMKLIGIGEKEAARIITSKVKKIGNVDTEKFYT